MARQKESFLSGAMILAGAGLISRVLGAVYRIPLSRVVGDEGIGLYQMAYPVYTMVLAISTVGIPLAISKLVAEKLAKRDGVGAYRVFQLSFILLLVTGLVFTVGMFLVARPYAIYVTKDIRAELSIKALAPAIMIVTAMSAFRGFFQGLQKMTPTAVSQVLEQVTRVITMFILAYLLLPRGVEFAAAGATFGAFTGALVGLGVMGFIYWRSRPTVVELLRARGRPQDSDRFIIARIASLSLPVSLAAIVMPLMTLMDSLVVPSRLQALGFEPATATALYGQLTGMAFPVMAMPTVVTAALSASLVPAVSEALALNDLNLIRHRAQASLRLTFLFTLPAVAGLYLLAREISAMLFREPQAGIPLMALSAGLMFLALQQTTSGILQGLGRTDIPVKNLLVGVLAKVAVTWSLTGTAAWGIRGAAYGTVIGFLIAASLNYAAMYVLTGSSVDVIAAVGKPVIATVVMAVFVRGGYDWAFRLSHSNTVATLAGISAGVAVYGLVLLALGGVTRRDFEIVPKVGPMAADILCRLGLLKR